jgi:hypothetical protein
MLQCGFVRSNLAFAIVVPFVSSSPLLRESPCLLLQQPYAAGAS